MDQSTSNKTESGKLAMRDQIKAKWDKLTETDLSESETNINVLSGKIQRAYNRTKELADREVADFRKTCGCEATPPKLL